ncbi:hypothetical protein GCM10009564_35020 [Streptomyces thermogriseus]|uniref:Uncharacterized protein n=1 Tax=Streptomyces thermogriseus TaxID=75292 RepID=A0ABN1T1A7_9ACTN
MVTAAPEDDEGTPPGGREAVLLPNPARMVDAGTAPFGAPGRLTAGRDWRAGMGPTIGERPERERVPCAWAVP